ncbi:MAG: hypothetical protein KatS3mg115_1828 [Candidatus Poribacteria bacterium]|nr:MAG: hypothetical protein KatS3mg115_1828 [Candidatus Poribacteria bacterium]
MVEIARALRQRARLLILDEPTAALTEAETQRLFHLLQRLRKQGVALLYVSHRLDEVFRLADRITILRDGRTVGTWPVGEITETEVIRAMVGGTVEAYYARDESVLRRSGEPLLSVEGWTLWTPSGRRRIENVSFEVRAGEVLGIGGVVGAGRSELLLSLFGAWTGRREGRLRWKGQEVQIRNPQEALQRGIALVPEDRKRQGLMPDASILDNLALPNLEQYSPGGWIRWERAVAAAQRAIEQLRIRTAALTAPARHLSGGNQQKLVLGKWLPRRPRLLLLDEPTRGIDVGAKAEIHAWIAQRARQEGIAVLLTSSDLAELIALSDRLVVLHEGRIVGRFETTQGLTPAEGARLRDGRDCPVKGRLHWRAFAMLIALAALWGAFTWATEGVFLSGRNLLNLARQAAVVAVLACGMVFVIVAGQIDLSVGSLSGFLGACVALSIREGLPSGGAILLAIALGLGLGCFHGFLVAYQRVPAFVVTLGGLMVYRGAMLAVTQGETIPLPLESSVRAIGNGSLPPTRWGLPVPLLIVALVATVFWVVAQNVRFGRHVYAVGGNREAARLSGVRVEWITLWVFGLMGALCGIAGTILTARVGSASPEAGRLLELDAIAACVIGGSSLMGGQGSIPGALLGALIMESLNNGMSLANMGPFWQDIVKGTVLVLAVWFDLRVRQGRGEEG